MIIHALFRYFSSNKYFRLDMANRDIYIAHLRHRGSCNDTAMSLAAEIRQVVTRRRLTGLIDQLKFVYAPTTSHPPYATAYVAFTRRYQHENAVELLNMSSCGARASSRGCRHHRPHQHLDMSQSTTRNAPTLHHLANPIRPEHQLCQPRYSRTYVTFGDRRLRRVS